MNLTRLRNRKSMTCVKFPVSLFALQISYRYHLSLSVLCCPTFPLPILSLFPHCSFCIFPSPTTSFVKVGNIDAIFSILWRNIGRQELRFCRYLLKWNLIANAPEESDAIIAAAQYDVIVMWVCFKDVHCLFMSFPRTMQSACMYIPHLNHPLCGCHDAVLVIL